MGNHFYDCKGNMRYTYKNDQGVEKNTTLRQAKKYGWLPSVTTVFKIVDKPALNRWKRQQFLKGILNNQEKLDVNNDFDNMINFYSHKSEEESEIAKREGAAIHAAIEEYIKTQEPPSATSPAFRYIGRINMFLKKNFGDNFKLVSEHPFAANGYGGTIDMIVIDSAGKAHVCDFKTAKDSSFQKWTRAYPEENGQVASYLYGLNFNKQYNVVSEKNFIIKINRETDDIKAYELNQDEVKRGNDIFKSSLMLYAMSHDYPELCQMQNAQDMSQVEAICEEINKGNKAKLTRTKDQLQSFVLEVPKEEEKVAAPQQAAVPTQTPQEQTPQPEAQQVQTAPQTGQVPQAAQPVAVPANQAPQEQNIGTPDIVTENALGKPAMIDIKTTDTKPAPVPEAPPKSEDQSFIPVQPSLLGPHNTTGQPEAPIPAQEPAKKPLPDELNGVKQIDF